MRKHACKWKSIIIIIIIRNTSNIRCGKISIIYYHLILHSFSLFSFLNQKKKWITNAYSEKFKIERIQIHFMYKNNNNISTSVGQIRNKREIVFVIWNYMNTSRKQILEKKKQFGAIKWKEKKLFAAFCLFLYVLKLYVRMNSFAKNFFFISFCAVNKLTMK